MAKNWSLRRDGADLHSEVTISLSQALLGGTIRVPAVNDEVVFTVRQESFNVILMPLLVLNLMHGLDTGGQGRYLGLLTL